MNTEQKQHLVQVIKRHNQQPPSSATMSEWKDIDFLLSLIKEQEASGGGDVRVLNQIRERATDGYERASGGSEVKAGNLMLDDLHYVLSSHDGQFARGSTSMHSRCVEKVRLAGMWCDECGHKSTPNADGSCSTYGYNGVDCQAQPCICKVHWPATQHFDKLIKELESLSIQE